MKAAKEAHAILMAKMPRDKKFTDIGWHNHVTSVINEIYGFNEATHQEGEETDWDKLEKYFEECTNDIGGGGKLRKVNIAPHDLFEWFKKNLTNESKQERWEKQ